MVKFILILLLSFPLFVYGPNTNVHARYLVIQGPFPITSQQVQTLLNKYCEKQLIPIMSRIAYIESRNEPEQISETGDYGIFQLNWTTILSLKQQCYVTKKKTRICSEVLKIEKPEQLLEIEQNIKIACSLAKYLFKNYGKEPHWFTRWNSNKEKLRLKYLYVYNNKI